jgi:hypothetical protein
LVFRRLGFSFFTLGMDAGVSRGVRQEG